MKIRTTMISAMALALSLFATNALAAAYPGWYVGIQGGVTSLNTTDDTLQPTQQDFRSRYNAGWLGGISFGYKFAIGLRLELGLNHSENTLGDIRPLAGNGQLGGPIQDVDGTLTNNALMANVWYAFQPDSFLHPYIGFGVGAAQLEYERAPTGFSGKTTEFAYQAGVGLMFDLSHRWSAGIGYRYFATRPPTYEDSGIKLEGRYEENVGMFSLRYTFNANRPDADKDGVPDTDDNCPATPEGVAVDAQGCALDGDGDGVPNANDKCPNTPAGAKVDGSGCVMDSDGDGVSDTTDQCPNTPVGTKVGATGCALVVDTDGDGVPDDKDICPATPQGVQVMTNGCAAGQSVVLEGVKFKLDKAVLTPGARQILDSVVRTLKDSPNFKVEVAGYTGSTGSASYNMALSAQRAKAVKLYLVNHGIAADRLTTVGHGENNPIAANDTASGRAQNRRVELTPVQGN